MAMAKVRSFASTVQHLFIGGGRAPLHSTPRAFWQVTALDASVPSYARAWAQLLYNICGRVLNEWFECELGSGKAPKNGRSLTFTSPQSLNDEDNPCVYILVQRLETILDNSMTDTQLLRVHI